MKQYETKCLMLIICLQLFRCSSDNRPFPEFDLQNPDDSRIINLSEMLTDIHSVNLETADSILIGQYTHFLVGDRYIISIDGDKILQFSAEGKFIRVIAKAGKGPEEFQRVDAFALYEPNDILYINHRGDHKHIKAYNLKTGEAIKRIPTGIENLISQIIVFNDSTLLIVPRMNEDFNLYYLSTTGRIISGIAPPEAKGIGLQTSINKVLNDVYYMPKEYDTLYRVNGTEIEPYGFFKVEDRFTFTNNEIGNFVYLSAHTPAFILANKAHAKIFMNDDGETFGMDADKLTRFWIDKKDNSVCEISGFKNDYFGIKEELDPWSDYLFLTNDMGYISYSCIVLKKLIDSTLVSNNLNDTIRNRISSLNNQLKEDDNPVLVIGRLRRN